MLMIFISFIVLFGTDIIFNNIHSPKTKLENIIQLVIGVVGLITLITGASLYFRKRK